MRETESFLLESLEFELDEKDEASFGGSFSFLEVTWFLALPLLETSMLVSSHKLLSNFTSLASNSSAATFNQYIHSILLSWNLAKSILDDDLITLAPEITPNKTPSMSPKTSNNQEPNTDEMDKVKEDLSVDDTMYYLIVLVDVEHTV